MSKIKCDKQNRINNNKENIRNINSSMSIVYFTIRKNIHYIKEGTKLYYSLVKILLITFFIFIFTRSNHGEFYEKWRNKPNIKRICVERLNRSLYEYQISNNSNYFNNVYAYNEYIQIDNYNNVIDYLGNYVKNDILNNYEPMNINNEIINTKCNVLLRKQRVLYEEKTDVVTTSGGASETLGDIRNKIKSRTERSTGNIYENGMYGPKKGKIDNLSNKPTEFRRTNNTDYETKLRDVPTDVNDRRKINKMESEVKPKVINFRNGGVNKSRVVEYEVVPKIVTTKDEGNRKINRVEYEIRAKYDTTRKNEENNNDTETNDISSKVEKKKNEKTMKNQNVANDITKPKTDTTQQKRSNSKSNDMNGVKSNVTTSKEIQPEKPSNNNQMKQGTNPFIDDDVSDKKYKLQDSNKGLKVTTNSTNVKNKLGDNNNQMKHGTNPFIDDDVSDKKENLQDSNNGLKKGTNPFIDEDELEEILRLEREEKLKNENKKNGVDNQNKISNPRSPIKSNNKNKQNSQNAQNETDIPNKLDSQNVPNKQIIADKLDNENKENTQCNKNVNIKKSDIGINEKSSLETSKDNQLTGKNNDAKNKSVKTSKFKDVLLDVAQDIENGISSDILNKNEKGKKLKSEYTTQNEVLNKNTRNIDDSDNLFEKACDLQIESQQDFNISQESGLDYTDEYEGDLNKEYDSYSDRDSTTMEYEEYYDEYCDYDDNYVGNPMKLFTSDIMNNYGNIKSGLKHKTNKIARTVLKGIDDIDDEESSIKEKNENKKKNEKDKIVIDKEDTSDKVSLYSTDSEGYFNNKDYYGNGNFYRSDNYYDSDMYSNSDDSDSDDNNPITVLASEIVDACGNIKGGALKVKDLITEGGPQLLDITANVVGGKTKDGLNKVKDIVSKTCGIDIESDIDLETETNPIKWHQVIRHKYRKLHFGWKLFLNIGPPAVLGIITAVVCATASTTGIWGIPLALMAGMLFFQVYRLTKKLYYNKGKRSIKELL
ncbi:EMP1-trafficking protein [Plasmodium sp.]|nr:EMP1-trafficking protein [Plasmodium sp.]